jgi:hypothetical protein
MPQMDSLLLSWVQGVIENTLISEAFAKLSMIMNFRIK